MGGHQLVLDSHEEEGGVILASVHGTAIDLGHPDFRNQLEDAVISAVTQEHTSWYEPYRDPRDQYTL